MYSPGLTIKYKNITGEYFAWIRGSVEIMYPSGYHGEMPALVFTFNHGGKCYKYFARDLVINRYDNEKWSAYSIDYQTPEIRDINDDLKVYIWQRGKMPVFVRNLAILAFEPLIN